MNPRTVPASALSDATVRAMPQVTLTGQLLAVVTSTRWVDVTVRVAVDGVVEVDRG